MTTPPEPTPPPTVGTSPRNAEEVNALVGLHLRNFQSIKNTINQDEAWIESVDLKVEPYNFSADQETLIKSAIIGLDTVLDAVDMTFITRLIGMY